MKIILSFLLVVVAVLAAIIPLFTHPLLYSIGYAVNDVQVENKFEVTREVTKFFSGGELTSFSEVERVHLEEVRSVYTTGRIILAALLLFIILNIKKKFLFSSLRQTSVFIFVLAGVLFVLGLNWSWFFTQFHQVLFSSQWMFSFDTLSIQLWGGNFFVVGAILAWLQLVQIGFVCIGIESISRQ
ncbi:DUF1461 domain-containing protein [Candidatus Woesearchaeota archaeon]|nr:DUF1461 domain-containing protein [Candidatus Woesearchaeota archaeon]